MADGDGYGCSRSLCIINIENIEVYNLQNKQGRNQRWLFGHAGINVSEID